MGVVDHASFFKFLKFADDDTLFFYFHSTYTVAVLDLVNTAMAAIVIHEYFVHLAAELRTWKLLFEGRFMPARMAVIIVRYSWIGAYVNALIFLHGSPKASQCILHFRLVYGLYCILWAFSGSIFLMRLNIIFGRQKQVMAAYITLWLAGLGCWIFVVTRLGAEPLPVMLQQPYGPKCITKRFPQIGAIGWGASILFDSCVFLGTLYRFHVTAKTQDKTTQLRSRKWLFRSNLYYFGSSCFFNLACFLSSLLVDDIVLSQIGTPIAFAMHTVTASRLVFNAKGWARGDTLGDEDDVILNTFNKNRRENPTNRIMYTVDETVVTSVGGIESMHAGNESERENEGDESGSTDKTPKGSDIDDVHDHISPHKLYHDRTFARRSTSLAASKEGIITMRPASPKEGETKLREMPNFQHVAVSPPEKAHSASSLPQDVESQGGDRRMSQDFMTVSGTVPPSYSSDARLRRADEPPTPGSLSSEPRQHPYSSASQPRSPRSVPSMYHQSLRAQMNASDTPACPSGEPLPAKSILRKTSQASSISQRSDAGAQTSPVIQSTRVKSGVSDYFYAK